jgi:hypothetical protein
VLGGGICECIWLGENDVTLSMVKQTWGGISECIWLGDNDMTLSMVKQTY